MDIQKAKEILSILADGTNPITGEALASYDSCNQADVVRALHSVLMELDKQPKKNPQPQPRNAGKPWTTDEEERLIAEYKSSMQAYEIAKIHGRTQRAIAARLVHLDIVKQREDVQ